MILQFFVPLLGAMLIVLLITPLSILIAQYFHLVDEPNSAPHKVHQHPVPRGGGLAIAAAVFVLAFVSGKFSLPDIRTIFVAAFIILVFGIWDDAKGLSASWKLL